MEKVFVKHLSDKDWYLQHIEKSQRPTGKKQTIQLENVFQKT